MLTPDGSGSPILGADHRILYDHPIPVEECDLPLKLPEMTDFHPGNNPEGGTHSLHFELFASCSNPVSFCVICYDAGCLARAMEWRYFQKEDGKWYARETNTMPQVTGEFSQITLVY